MIYTTDGAVLRLVERGYSWHIASLMVAAMQSGGIQLTIDNVEAAR